MILKEKLENLIKRNIIHTRSIGLVLLWEIIFIISIFLELRVPVLGKIIFWVLTCIFGFGHYNYFLKIKLRLMIYGHL